ncbi:MAG: hypothetical protein V1696_03840 [Candidatus Jorgensenbacteria bacterium]
MDENVKKMEALAEKIRALKEKGTVDLSSDEDLSIAIMNLVSLEEHFFFTAEKTKKSGYLDLLRETRELRKELLAKMMPQNEGETWCISKHLLAATMRIMEVGTKALGEGKREEAEKLFGQAYRVYALFWGLRLKLIDAGDMKKIGDDKLNIHDENGMKKPWTLEDILEKLVDCCDE